jgi:hypothetical protein
MTCAVFSSHLVVTRFYIPSCSSPTDDVRYAKTKECYASIARSIRSVERGTCHYDNIEIGMGRWACGWKTHWDV